MHGAPVSYPQRRFYLASSTGCCRHACPGQFFAANELKAMMAHVVLTYDLSLEKEGPSSQAPTVFTAPDESGLELDVMATTILNRTAITTPSRFMSDAEVSDYQDRITEEIMQSVLQQSLNPLTTPRFSNKATRDAVFRDLDQAQLHSLSQAEIAVTSIAEELGKITRVEAASAILQTKKALASVQILIQDLRLKYPDMSPIRIDNRDAYHDITESISTPTLIAYTLALCNRIFDKVALRGSSFLLKGVKLFGLSLIKLGGGEPTLLQQNALDAIPDDMRTLEKRFNLDVKTVAYAVCPTCAYTHEPDHSERDSTYPATCTYRHYPGSPPCATPLLKHGKPIKLFHYYPFFTWFGRLLALPGMQAHGDAFCDAIAREPIAPDVKRETWDGSFYREFQGPDGRLFVSDRGAEGRWFFLLHSDFFNIEGTLVGGKHSSTGVMSMTCLNLPWQIRDDPAYTYIPGIIQGPHEPKVEDAQHRHYLRPLVDELVAGYERGVQCFSTHGTHANADEGYKRTERLAVAGVIMDLKAARPFAGLLDVTSHSFCYSCTQWHHAHLWRFDVEAWTRINDLFLRAGAQKWREAETLDMRKQVELDHAVRDTELYRLSYYRPSVQLLPDAMHIIFLVLLKRYFRDCLRLGRAPNEARRAPIAHYFNFTQPPHLSSIHTQDDQELTDTEDNDEDDPLDVLEWGHLPEEIRSNRSALLTRLKDEATSKPIADNVANAHQRLSYPSPNEDKSKEILTRRLDVLKWSALLYVCVDLSLISSHLVELLLAAPKLPNTLIKKPTMVELLVSWVGPIGGSESEQANKLS
ncbi:hypothetical protein EUX98_g6153 [Antrodiella citrinella]|uniref:Uncharacterized protein n=1 Tax=Antrodiella citrinella TaxID=2447956 RepID=A0A4S4MRW5_9APHY|nr:hypothetical protein EUX98_g6153 [Antrodiella citrinella]